MRALIAPATLILLVACVPSQAPLPVLSDPLPLFGDGYPAPGDPCRRVGENAETVDFLDDAADLVACPDGTPAPASMFGPAQTRELARATGYVVYSVPTR